MAAEQGQAQGARAARVLAEAAVLAAGAADPAPVPATLVVLGPATPTLWVVAEPVVDQAVVPAIQPAPAPATNPAEVGTNPRTYAVASKLASAR